MYDSCSWSKYANPSGCTDAYYTPCMYLHSPPPHLQEKILYEILELEMPDINPKIAFHINEMNTKSILSCATSQTALLRTVKLYAKLQVTGGT